MVLVSFVSVWSVHGFISSFVPFAVHGAVYYAWSQVSHANAESEGVPCKGEWCTYQFNVARGDFAVKSYFWAFASVGLHLQAVHHMFPSIHWIHYPEIYPIICDVLREKGSTNSYADSFRMHWRFLAQLNDWRLEG